MPFTRIIVVYNSDHGLRGDLVYVVKKLTKKDSCPLCDITHVVREKADWRSCKSRLEVKVDSLYRDQLTPALRDAAAGDLPCVLAEQDGQTHKILGRAELEACAGSVERLEQALRAAGVS